MHQRKDGLTLTPCIQDQAQEAEDKGKRFKGVAGAVRSRLRVSMALGGGSMDKSQVAAVAARTVGAEQEQEQEASDASMARTSGNESSGPALQDHTALTSDTALTSESSSSRVFRKPHRPYCFGHTTSSFHRTASVMPIVSTAGGGGWANESHKWEVDGGIAGQGTAHDASVDKWPSDIRIPPPSCEDGHLAITRPHIVLHGQTFRVRLDKETLDAVFNQLAAAGSGQRPAELAEVLPSWAILEPIRLSSHAEAEPAQAQDDAPPPPALAAGGAESTSQAEKPGATEDAGASAGVELERLPARADESYNSRAEASQARGATSQAAGDLKHRRAQHPAAFAHDAEYLNLASSRLSPGALARHVLLFEDEAFRVSSSLPLLQANAQLGRRIGGLSRGAGRGPVRNRAFSGAAWW